jgi:hypothetical protein
MTPLWLRLSEPELSLAVMNRHAFPRMKFVQEVRSMLPQACDFVAESAIDLVAEAGRYCRLKI